jgi:hypothetical protein
MIRTYHGAGSKSNRGRLFPRPVSHARGDKRMPPKSGKKSPAVKRGATAKPRKERKTMQQHVSAKSLIRHGARSEGSVAELNRRYFAAYADNAPAGTTHEEIVEYERVVGAEMYAVDKALGVARADETSEVIALLEVAQADFDRFNRLPDGTFGDDLGDAIVANALESALRLLRTIAD